MLYKVIIWSKAFFLICKIYKVFRNLFKTDIHLNFLVALFLTCKSLAFSLIKFCTVLNQNSPVEYTSNKQILSIFSSLDLTWTNFVETELHPQ